MCVSVSLLIFICADTCADTLKELKLSLLLFSNSCSEAQVKLREGSISSDVVCGSASRNHYCSIFVFVLVTAVAVVIAG